MSTPQIRHRPQRTNVLFWTLAAACTVLFMLVIVQASEKTAINRGLMENRIMGRASSNLHTRGGVPIYHPNAPKGRNSQFAVGVFGWGKAPGKIPADQCFSGRTGEIPDATPKDATHFLLGTPMHEPFPEGLETVSLGMGCFWCSENLFMRIPGVYSTHVGYAQGTTPNPYYEEVCTGRTNHNEVVRIVYDPKKLSLKDILKIFWERHDPTTPNQQGNDRGTQYRSGIYFTTEEQRQLAEKSKETYQGVLKEKGFGEISTEIEPAEEFYFAESYHQQYDAKPGSRQYCGLSPLGTTFPAEKL